MSPLAHSPLRDEPVKGSPDEYRQEDRVAPAFLPELLKGSRQGTSVPA